MTSHTAAQLPSIPARTAVRPGLRHVGALAISALLAAASAPAGAAMLTYTAALSGAAEATPNASPATGSATLTLDDVLHSMRVQVDFDGLTAPNTAAHVHCCTVAVRLGTGPVATVLPTFTDFPTGATSGSYDHTFDMNLDSSWNASFINAHGSTTAQAFIDLLSGLDSGRAYLNIHNSPFPGGEIRGFLEAQQVPEPATAWLVLLAAGGLLGSSRSRRRS